MFIRAWSFIGIVMVFDIRYFLSQKLDILLHVNKSRSNHYPIIYIRIRQDSVVFMESCFFLLERIL